MLGKSRQELRLIEYLWGTIFSEYFDLPVPIFIPQLSVLIIISN